VTAFAELAPGISVAQTSPWETNVLLVEAAGEAVLVDPAFLPGDIRAIRDAVAARRPRSLTVLLTHADLDHVCGSGSFADAEIVAAADTAERVTRNAPAELDEAERAWGRRWDRPLRVDRIVAPGEALPCGARPVAAAHHGVDGLAYLFEDHAVLASGDFLSALAIPALLGSPEQLLRSYRYLLELVRAESPRWVVPAHGPVLSADEATEIGAADVAYLEEAIAAGRAGADEGLAPVEVALRSYAVEPPRTPPPAFALYGERITTAFRIAAAVCR
jgi:glyoxylase-like metal-dependent hydrolase (beta-lactamase superfamily II)